MKGFLKPKLIVTFVTLVLLAGAIFGSLTGNIFRAHAAGPGEHHHPIASAMNTKTDPSGAKVFSLVTDVACPSVKSIGPFTISDRIFIVASVSPTTPNDTEEAGEGENLILTETKGSFSQTVTVSQGIQTFEFTVPLNGDMLNVCIKGADQDEQAVVTLSETPPTAAQLRGDFIKLTILFIIKQDYIDFLIQTAEGLSCAGAYIELIETKDVTAEVVKCTSDLLELKPHNVELTPAQKMLLLQLQQLNQLIKQRKATH